jgi:hypothetical protein
MWFQLSLAFLKFSRLPNENLHNYADKSNTALARFTIANTNDIIPSALKSLYLFRTRTNAMKQGSSINIKYRLIEKLVKTEDQELLKQVESILDGKAYWESLPYEVKEAIDQSVAEGEEGKLEDHESVIKDYRRSYVSRDEIER